MTVYPELTGHGMRLNEGLVPAIEPMVGLGNTGLVMSDDGWTIATADRSPSAHAEHSIVVRTGDADILTAGVATARAGRGWALLGSNQ